MWLSLSSQPRLKTSPVSSAALIQVTTQPLCICPRFSRTVPVVKYFNSRVLSMLGTEYIDESNRKPSPLQRVYSLVEDPGVWLPRAVPCSEGADSEQQVWAQWEKRGLCFLDRSFVMWTGEGKGSDSVSLPPVGHIALLWVYFIKNNCPSNNRAVSTILGKAHVPNVPHL